VSSAPPGSSRRGPTRAIRGRAQTRDGPTIFLRPPMTWHASSANTSQDVRGKSGWEHMLSEPAAALRNSLDFRSSVLGRAQRSNRKCRSAAAGRLRGTTSSADDRPRPRIPGRHGSVATRILSQARAGHSSTPICPCHVWAVNPFMQTACSSVENRNSTSVRNQPLTRSRRA
jgi:hypothetical protein